MRHLLLFGLVLITQCGCLTLTATETGRTVGEGNAEMTVSAASGTYADLSIGGSNDTRLDDPADEDEYARYIPVIEVGRVIGIGKRTDIGFQVNSAQFFSARVKQQFFGTKSSFFAASIGVEGGINPGAFVFGGVAYLYGTIPVYLSLHPCENIALYAVPRYAFTSVSEIDPSSVEREGAFWDYPGLTYGITVGRDRRVAVELSHLGHWSLMPSQLSIGFSLRLDWGD